MYSWSFSEDERDLLNTLEKKLRKFVETALYALRRNNWCKNLFWKIWNLNYSFRFREKKLTTGSCEFHSTCTDEQFGKKYIVKKFINFQSFRIWSKTIRTTGRKKFARFVETAFYLSGEQFFGEILFAEKNTWFFDFFRFWPKTFLISTKFYSQS